VRVSSGRLKGRELAYPRAGLRPTKAVTRQAMFNVIGSLVQGAKVCDLYAGAGSLGIEALSRGADSVVFVEEHGPTLAFLRRNLAGLQGVHVVRGGVLRVLTRLAGAGFDLVLADPPYRRDLVQATIDRTVAADLLVPGGLLVIEHHKKELPTKPENWDMVRRGEYGDTMVSVMRRRA
jgi:16S rRNA (guanine966-N2)-methyltransferase